MMTKEELTKLSDVELFAMVQKSLGHTGKDFGEHMDCDFSYSFLTKELKRRGWENGWHKLRDNGDVTPEESQTDVVRLAPVPLEKTTRKTFLVSTSVAERWNILATKLPYKTAATDAALNRFLDDYEAGHLKFELDV